MDDITSSGDDHYAGSSRYNQRVPARVVNLTSTLQDTNKNLRTVDKMLESYKDLGEQQASAMDKLRDDLLKTSERLKEEKSRRSRQESHKPVLGGIRRNSETYSGRRRYPTSPLKDYDFDRATSDYDERDTSSPNRRRSARERVRFHDDMDADESVHELHRSLRDLNSGQLRIEDDLNLEITRRNRYEHENTRAMKNVADTLHRGSVDARLDTIQNELHKERHMLQKNQENVGQLSSQLQLEITDSRGKLNKDEEMALRTSVVKTQTEKNIAVKELEKARHRLELAEGSKSSIINQNEELRRQLLKAEDEKQRFKDKIERQEQHIKQQQVEGRDRDFFDRERKRLEDEVSTMHSQLTKSASALGEVSGIHKELEKSERQRQQLSDHIQVLQKELESGDKQSAKLLKNLAEMTDAYNRADNERQSLESQMKFIHKELKETSKNSEGLSDELKDSQLMLHDSQHKREEMKIRAQETVKQWKAKCKRQEKEIGILRLNTQQLSTRCEQMAKELDMTKSLAGHSSQQVEVLRRELNQLVAIRAQQEEDVRIKDVQVNELKSFRADLEKDLRDCKVVIERMEHEMHMIKDKGTGVLEEKMKIEDQFNNMQQGQLMAQNQIHHLQKEVKELSLIRVNLAGQLAEAANEKMELKNKVKEARRSEANVREEMEILIKRVKEDKKVKNQRLGALTNEVNTFRSNEAQTVENINHQRKRELAEYHADIQAVRMELEGEKSSSKIMKKQNHKLKSEVDRVNIELANKQEDLAEAQRKYHLVREEYIARSHLTEDGLSRAKELDLQLLDFKDVARRTEKDHTNILHTIAAEIDGVIEVAAMDSIETYKALNLVKNPSEPNGILAEVKSKLHWLKNELRELRHKENNMKTDIKDAVFQADQDRNLLMAEIERQSEALEQLAFHREKVDIPERDLHDSSVLQMEDLAPSTETQMSHITGTHVTDTMQSEFSIDDSILMKTQEERERIHERYSRLQDTMSALRQELFAQKRYADVIRPENGSALGTPNGRQSRRVRISSPPTQEFSPSLRRQASSRSPAAHRSYSSSPARRNHSRSPARARSPARHVSDTGTHLPLTLTDEEFNAMFVPKSPPKFLTREAEMY